MLTRDHARICHRNARPCITELWPAHISDPAVGRRLSWHGWLAHTETLYRERSSVSVPTGIDVITLLMCTVVAAELCISRGYWGLLREVMFLTVVCLSV